MENERWNLNTILHEWPSDSLFMPLSKTEILQACGGFQMYLAQGQQLYPLLLLTKETKARVNSLFFVPMGKVLKECA